MSPNGGSPEWLTCKVWGAMQKVVHLQSLGGGRTLFPIIKIDLYDCPGMLFRGSYSLLLVWYSTAVINLDCLLEFFFNSCFHVLSSRERTKAPGTAKTVATAFCSCRHGEHSAGRCLPQTTFRSAIGDKRTRFPRNNSNANMHRSDSFYPASAVWTVVCCALDSAGGFRKLPFAREQTAYVSSWT